MKILALETATEACSAALLLDGHMIERYRLAPREHTRLILPMIDSLLDEARIRLHELDALAFGRGPGSFTGVRIAAGIVQGLAMGAELPVVPVSTLAAMAHGCFAEYAAATAFVALDARMGEVYWGVYQKDANSGVRLLGEEAVLAADAIEFELSVPDQSAGIGSGWGSYAEILGEGLKGCVKQIAPEIYPRASSVAVLAQQEFRQGLALPPKMALPIYLRNQVARKPGKVNNGL